MLTETEMRLPESRCTKFTRALLGGLWGATCGLVRPVAQWLLNAWENTQEKKAPANGRTPVVVDMLATTVVLYGSVVRFGMPMVWFFVIADGLLVLQGAYRGAQIGWRVELKKSLKEIPQELWVWEDRGDKIVPFVQNNSFDLSKYVSFETRSVRVCNGAKGAVVGVLAGAALPYIQLYLLVKSAKRFLPVLINAGFVNTYAVYVGAAVYMNQPTVAWNIWIGLEASLAAYGGIKGMYIGYTDGVTKVCKRLWQGGLSEITNLSNPSQAVCTRAYQAKRSSPLKLKEIATNAIPTISEGGDKIKRRRNSWS